MSKPRTTEGRLSWRAETLLLWLLLYAGWGGSVEAGAEDLARAVGLAKRQDVYQAVDELVEHGWLEKEGGRGGRGGRIRLLDRADEVHKDSLEFSGVSIIRGSLRSPHVNGESTVLRLDDSILSYRGPVQLGGGQGDPALAQPEMEATEHEKVYPEQVQGAVPGAGTGVYPERVHLVSPQTVHVPGAGTPGVPGAGTPPTRPKSLLSRIVEADRMPLGDDKLRGPFQDRRRTQVPLVQEAWAEFFPNANPLTTTNAKQMLTLADDMAEDLYEQFRDLAEKKPQHPLSYVLAVLRKQRPQVVAPAAAPAPAQGEYVFELAPVTEEYKQRQREAMIATIKMGLYTPKLGELEELGIRPEEVAR